MTHGWQGLGPDSGFGFAPPPEFGFGSVSARGVRIRIGFDTRGSDSDRFRRSRFVFGSDRPPQVRIRIGDRFSSDSASEPGAWGPRHQNEMVTGYGLASSVVSAAILVGLRCIYAANKPYIILNQYAALTQRSPGWRVSL